MGYSDCPGPQSDSAGKSDACQGCPNQQVCATTPKGPDPGLSFQYFSTISSCSFTLLYVHMNIFTSFKAACCTYLSMKIVYPSYVGTYPTCTFFFF